MRSYPFLELLVFSVSGHESRMTSVESKAKIALYFITVWHRLVSVLLPPSGLLYAWTYEILSFNGALNVPIDGDLKHIYGCLASACVCGDDGRVVRPAEWG